MKKFKIDDFAYIHGGPTTGKSTLLGNYLAKGGRCVDPDQLIFGFLMTGDQKEKLEKVHGKLWHASGDARIAWDIIVRGGLALATTLVVDHDFSLITNLTPDYVLKNKSISFFRKPEDLAFHMNDRNEKKGKPINKDAMKIATSWFDSWSKYRHFYAHSFVLERDEFISDYFDVDIEITDPLTIDKMCYEYTYTELKRLGYFLFLEPTPKTQKTVI